jgi:7-cyano-7-deazaguanine synthase
MDKISKICGGAFMKALILFSGGLDSTTMLAMAVKKYGAENCAALSLYYGQRHAKEIKAAKKIAKYYKVKRYSLDVSKIFQKSECALLKGRIEQIQNGSYEEQLRTREAVTTYVPYRNGLFLSIAASMALSLGCDIICYGAHRDDAAGDAYPDCSEAFNEAIKTAVYLGSGKKITVYAPFIDKKKSDIVKIGTELKVPYEMTWSCYKGEKRPCGVCGTCIDRREAFEKNGLKDPLEG